MLPEGIRRFFRLERGARSAEADVDLELAHHFAAAVEDLVRRGTEPEEARRIAGRRFGDVRATRTALVTLAKDRAGRRRRMEWRGDWWMDVRQAIRGYASTPGFTGAVVTMLALGVGANAAMYGILDKLFLRPPPHIIKPGETVRLYFTQRDDFTGRAFTHGQADFEQYTALARHLKDVKEVAGYWQMPGTVGKGLETERVATGTVTGNFFSFLGVKPLLGRFIGPTDDHPSATPVAVVGYAYWRRHLAGSEAALGITVLLDRMTYTIIGVAPPGFSGPGADAADIWVPAQVAGAAAGPNWRDIRYGGLSLRPLARLRHGVAPAVVAEQATAVLNALPNPAPAPGYPALPPRAKVRVLTGPIMEAQGPLGGGQYLRLPLVVGGVALILLVIACANVANLLTLRAVTRRRELAVRSALGAGRWRVARMLSIESTLLALAAGVAAIAVAAVTGRVLRVVLVPGTQWATGVVDLRVLLFAGVVALALGLITGAMLAVQARRGAGVDDLRAGVRAARRASTPVRAGLLVVQGALALVLVVGAAAFFRSFDAARRHDPGYAVKHLLVVTLGPTDPADRSPLPETAISTMQARVRHLPGVAAVAQSTSTSVGPLSMIPLRVRGIASLPRMGGPFVWGVTPDFFRAWGLPLTRGRAFSEADGEGGSKVAVVNTAMAQALWPSADPLGTCLYVGRSAAECTTVVGVVETASPLEGQPVAVYYVPLAQYGHDSGRGSLMVGRRSLVVRATGDPSHLVQPVLRVMADLFPELPRERVRALPQSYARSLRSWKVGLGLFGAAGVLALFVAAVGLYAVITYSVRQREHEFGIRRALGANVGDIVRLVMAQSVAFAALGTLVGAALAYGGARFVTPLLYQNISPRDPSILITSGVVLLAACLAAGFLPARTAGRADPREALQAE